MSKLVTNSNLTFDSFIKQLSHAEIYKKIIDIGTKWAEIAKSLDKKRTEHMIKNRFKSTIKKMEKLYPYSSQKKIILKIIENINKLLKNQCQNNSIKEESLNDQAGLYSKVKKQQQLFKESIYQTKLDLELNLPYFAGIQNIKIQVEEDEQMIQINQDNFKFHSMEFAFSNDLFMQLTQMKFQKVQQF